MVYSSRPRKIQRTGTMGKRGRSKSRQSRKFSSAGPSRTLVPRQLVPEIKRKDRDFDPTNGGFQQHACFNVSVGTGATSRIGNAINMYGLKVKFDLTGAESGTGTNYSIYIIRDTEPLASPPISQSEWSVALFSSPIHSSWRNNFRNVAYTERFQIVRKFDAAKSDYTHGLKSLDGYMSVPLNGQVAKYSGSSLLPTNTTYYVLYWCGDQEAIAHTPLIRIREEWTD